MSIKRADVVEIVRAADDYAMEVSAGDKDEYMSLFIKALMDGIHAVDPDMAQRIKKSAMEKHNGLDRTGL